MAADKDVALQVDKLLLSFGGVFALHDVSLDVRDNEILAVIGPNGAGKTALLNCISGFYKPQQGEIYFNGQKITRMRPDKLAKLGIARTFQNIELYSGLSTQDNIMAARHVLMKQNFITGGVVPGLGASGGNPAPPGGRRDYRLLGNGAHAKKKPSVFCLTGCEKGSSWAGPWRLNRKYCCSMSPWRG